MSAKSFKKCVLDKMDAIDWANTSSSQMQDKSFTAISDGIYEYLNNKDNFTSVVGVTGVALIPAAPAPIPVPLTNVPVDISMTFLPAAKLKASLLANCIIPGSVFGPGILGFFTALTSYVASVVTTITGWQATGFGSVSGAGVTLFTAMAASGAAALSDLSASPPTDRDAAWTKIEKYAILGLTAGATAISPVAGSITASGAVLTPASCAGAGTVTYK